MSAESSERACRLLLIGGSLRAGSSNAAVLRTAQLLVPSGTTAEIYDGLASLPAFNPDDDREPLPLPAAKLRARLSAADAVLFSTPEYAGALPGAFKNLLDWTVGGGMYGMPVGYINASAFGAAKGTHDQLRIVLGYISAQLVEAACVQISVRRDQVGARGVIDDPAIRSAISAALAALAQHAASHRRTVI